MALQLLLFAAVALVAIDPLKTFGQDMVVYPVTCNYLTPNCECPLQNSAGENIDVCEFQLEISAIQTFTRYMVNNTITEASSGGELWIIDADTGELMRHPLSSVSTYHCGDLDNVNCTEPYTVDGYTFRDFIAINGRLPGPTLIVNQGQILSVNVSNKLDSDVVSIHWHGLDQRNTNFMDGVEHVTQCGVSPGASFRYLFEAAQTGTYWYHSHTGTQRTDGLFGALIFKESEDLINRAEQEQDVGEFVDQPDNHTLVFVDWQLKSSLELFTLLQGGTHYYNSFKVPGPTDQPEPATDSPDGAEVAPVAFWSALVNGRGRYYEVDYVQTRLSIFTVAPSTQYRFRMVGAQGLFAFRVSIDGHKLKVFAMDGTFVKPREVDFIIIHSGERYDFLLETKSVDELDGNSDFAIRGETLEIGIAEPHVAEAILHYDIDMEPLSTEYADIFNETLRVSQTCTENNRCTALNCPFKIYPPSFYTDCIPVSDLELLFPLDDSQLPDVVVPDEDKVFLNFAFEGSGGGASINARTHILPSSPLALLNDDEYKAVRDAEFCTGLGTDSVCDNNPDFLLNPECICTHVQELQYNRSIQLVISAVSPNYDPNVFTPFFFASHPIHLHGHQFQVADIQFGEYNAAGELTRANDSIVCGGENLCTNPSWREGRDYSIGRTGKVSNTAPLKDTVFLPAGGHVVLYFQSNNPGYWYLHCHIEVHQLQGMAMIISEALDEQLDAPSQMDSCGNFTWSLEEFYQYLQGDAPTRGLTDDDDDDDDDAIILGLSVGLGTGLLLSLLVNIILFILFCCCCIISRDSHDLRGA